MAKHLNKKTFDYSDDVLDGNVYHYRDKTGLECDAVVHLMNLLKLLLNTARAA